MPWYVITTKCRAEVATARNLAQVGYEVYCPLARVDKRKNLAKEVECLFPRYIFCQLIPGRDDFHPIMRTTGVVSFVRFGLWPATIPDALVDEIRRHEDGQGIHKIAKFDYAVGDEVKIRSGLFQGYEAVIKARKRDRIIVLLDMASQETRLEIAYRDVEPLSA